MKIYSKVEIKGLVEKGQEFIVLEEGSNFVVVMANDGATIKLYENEFEVVVKSNMELRVNFLSGTDISQAIDEAKSKAKMWDLAYVKFSFNGIEIAVSQGSNVKEGVEKYQQALRDEGWFGKHKPVIV